MLKENPSPSRQPDLFRSRLESIIDMRHELVKLSNLADWDGLQSYFSQFYCMDNGRPAGSIRLMVGLFLLKEAKGLSDEEVCAVWRENPYFQYFCGEEYFQHRLPVEPPSLSIFRKRIGEQGAERILKETISIGIKSGIIKIDDVDNVTVDTTVQEKAVKFPTDAQLCHKARTALAEAAAEAGIPLRQSYARKGKSALIMAGRYMAARQIKRGRRKIKEIRNYLGRVMRDIERKIAADPLLCGRFAGMLAKAGKIFAQTLNPKHPDKIYSWHAPEVECIAKGKLHKKYEFGCKSSYVVTNKSNFIVGSMALHGAPYDGHTLEGALGQTVRLTGVVPKEAQVDLGYRGVKFIDPNLAKTRIILPGQKRGVTPKIRKRQKRRNAVEPIIGHVKNDRKIGPRNFLKGEIGDKINAIAVAVGFNLRKILRAILFFLVFILSFGRELSQEKPIAV